jgi:O-succinylhomoserine sulfhydrylase
MNKSNNAGEFQAMLGEEAHEWAAETQAVRAGTHRSQFGEHGEALYLTSSYVFNTAAEAKARFVDGEPGMVYARFTNPTVMAFEERLAALEGAEAASATASGMSAILSTCLGLLKAGDHIVASASVFGATIQLFSTILSRFGVTTTYVALSDPAAWRAACTPQTKMFYLETPSNPLTEVGDIAAISAIARAAGAVCVVDNCFCTPVLQRPLELGADLVIHSATKYLDGQGRVLGGAVCGSEKLIKEAIVPILRSAGPTLSAFNAWVLLKGMETLEIRMERQSSNALQVARWLESQPGVTRVLYPGLPSHPQHALAKAQAKAGGAIVSFEVAGGREAAWRIIDACKLWSRTTNLGDTKSTISHPATTSHGRITADARERAGISEGMVRLAVGLESVKDLQADLRLR